MKSLELIRGPPEPREEIVKLRAYVCGVHKRWKCAVVVCVCVVYTARRSQACHLWWPIPFSFAQRKTIQNVFAMMSRATYLDSKMTKYSSRSQ